MIGHTRAFESTLEEFRRTVEGPALEVSALRAALLVAQAERPGLDIDDYERQLEEWASELHERLDPAEPGEHLEELGAFIFEELHFGGDSDTYNDVANLLLDRVIERHAGIPVTLAIIYQAIAESAGIPIRVVGLPGHVVARLDRLDDEPVFVDVFHEGSLLTSEGCRELVRRVYGRDTWFRDYHLEPITPRQVVQRLLHNLKANALRAGDEARAARVIELLLALYPWDLDERRDRGMLAERVGDYPAALEDLEVYLRHRPGARDAETVAETIRTLRRHVVGR
jgi:regulator of sirC expression with transglutaminase-like and TPR domain